MKVPRGSTVCGVRDQFQETDPITDASEKKWIPRLLTLLTIWLQIWAPSSTLKFNYLLQLFTKLKAALYLGRLGFFIFNDTIQEKPNKETYKEIYGTK